MGGVNIIYNMNTAKKNKKTHTQKLVITLEPTFTV